MGWVKGSDRNFKASHMMMIPRGDSGWVKGPILILFWRGGGVEVAMKGERLAPP